MSVARILVFVGIRHHGGQCLRVEVEQARCVCWGGAGNRLEGDAAKLGYGLGRVLYVGRLVPATSEWLRSQERTIRLDEQHIQRHSPSDLVLVCGLAEGDRPGERYEV